MLREQSRGDFLPSRETGLRAAQEGVSRVSCTKVEKGEEEEEEEKKEDRVRERELTWWQVGEVGDKDEMI